MDSSPTTPASADVTELVRDASRGDRAAQRRLIDTVLMPLVQVRVGRVLLRRSAGRRNLREEMRDLAQEVLIHLFTSGALADWDPARGPFGAYAGRIAENRTISLLRGRVRNPWAQVPLEDEDIERRLGAGSGEPDGPAASRSALRRLAEMLSDAEWELFFLFFVEERTAEEVSALRGSSLEAVRKQRQRLRAHAESLLARSGGARTQEAI
jgi:RNA polymerase sigma factor (sigma-70 family)